MTINKKTVFVGGAVFLIILGLFVFRNPLSRLRGTPKNFHYRFAVRGGLTIDQQIKGYETRLSGPNASGIELGMLADLYYAKGRRTGDTALFDRAADIARRALSNLPSPNLLSKGVLAKVAAAKHQFPESIRIAKEMLAENGGSEGAHAILAANYLAIGDLPHAAEFADRLVLIKPDSSNTALRALVLLAQGREPEGAFEFARALDKEDLGEPAESSWIRTVFGRYYLKRGDLRLARQLFQEAIRITPEFPLALDLLGQLEAREFHYAKAESYFNEAFAVSRQIPYLLHLAVATSEKGDRRSSEILRSQAEQMVRTELDAGTYGHRLDLVRLLLDKGTPGAVAEAIKLARQETLVRQNAETYYLLSFALGRAKHWDEAREVIYTALRSGTREPEFYYQAAQAEKYAGNQLRSVFYLEQTGQLDPSFQPPEEQTAAPLKLGR